MTWPTNLTDAAYAQQVLGAVKAGQASYVFTKITSQANGHTGEFLVMRDALKVDGVRVAVTAALEQQIADALGCLLLTPKLADLHYAARTASIPPFPMSATAQDIALMQTSARMVLESQKMDAALHDAGFDPSDDTVVVGTVGKHWVIAKVLATAASGTAVNYGWFMPTGTHTPWNGVPLYPSVTLTAMVVQQPSTKHNDQHVDYSQQCTLVHRDCVIDGNPWDLKDVLADPVLCALVSNEGPLTTVRQPSVSLASCPVPGVTTARVMALTTTTPAAPAVCPLPPRPDNVTAPAVPGSSGAPVAAIVGVAAAAGLGVIVAHYAMRRWGRSAGGRGRRENPAGSATTAVGAAVGALTWEGAWAVRRRVRRGLVFRRAQARARALGRPLLVVGAPDRGTTSGYPCGDPRYGDTVIDIGPSTCPNARQVDITRRLPYPDNSAVIFVSCVLEYVSDIDSALRELRRVSGGELFTVGVEPWCATSFAYPGARRVLPARLR